MKERMDIGKAEPRIYKAMEAAEKYLASFDLNPGLAELVKLRVSQLNGCGYCVNLHSGDARKAGETEQRVYAVSAWRETPFFTEKERAVLQLAEEVTGISEKGLSEESYRKAREYFSETEVAQLLFAVTLTNSWNRLAIAVHMVAE
ncbi:carboxymuconolactone decarboxylase family protein [Sinomicrobium sp. M5D2P9]